MVGMIPNADGKTEVSSLIGQEPTNIRMGSVLTNRAREKHLLGWKVSLLIRLDGTFL